MQSLFYNIFILYDKQSKNTIMSVHHKYTKDFKEKIENLIKFNTILTQKIKQLFRQKVNAHCTITLCKGINI